MKLSESSHFNPNNERRGIGTNLLSMSHATLATADVTESLAFYCNVLGFEMLTATKSKAIVQAPNLRIELVKGEPQVFSGENLIVGHMALDVFDPAAAFQRLADHKVLFEINVSVPKGKGKAESEGGSKGNTVHQAFIRDPSGYYFEICNCHVLDNFVLGLEELDQSFNCYEEGISQSLGMQCMKFGIFAARAKHRIHRTSSMESTCDPLSSEQQPEEADATILANFLRRQLTYGDICQSFDENELKCFLREGGNDARKAILLMQQAIASGRVTKKYLPPSYYVNGTSTSDAVLYKPVALQAGDDEASKTHHAVFTAGVEHARHLKGVHHDGEEKKDDCSLDPSSETSEKQDTVGVPKPESLMIEKANHVAVIVSDVGKSAWFYSDVLGCQQVSRPNFDRHGAWFTSGNVEVHLILGNPLVPPPIEEGSTSAGEVCCSTTFRVADVCAAQSTLERLDVPFHIDVEGAVVVRDPDGYVYRLQQQDVLNQN